MLSQECHGQDSQFQSEGTGDEYADRPEGVSADTAKGGLFAFGAGEIADGAFGSDL